MCEITTETKSPLLPDRLNQGDPFVYDIFYAVPKCDMASMVHPIFLLSTKPDHRIHRYEDEIGKDFADVIEVACFLGQDCGFSKVHLVCVHAAFRMFAWVKYAVSGVRLSRAV